MLLLVFVCPCQGRRFILEIIYGSSIFFIKVGFLGKPSLSIWLVLLAGLLWGGPVSTLGD